MDDLSVWNILSLVIIIVMMKLVSIGPVALLRKGSCFFSSSLVDPYYILGVDKQTPFPEIKKTFYKLANQFHPDKNSSLEAQQKFVIIKQAFESIKMEKGMMKPQNLYRSEDRQSMRPNPEKFTPDDSENMKNFRDYTIFAEKARTKDQYMSFNSSFKTISDINEIKIKVEEGQMKDPILRFGLQQFKGKISSYSQGNLKYFFVLIAGLTIFTFLTNQMFNQKDIQVKEGALKKLTQIHKRKTIESELIENKKIDILNLQQSADIRQMQKKFIQEEMLSKATASLKEKVIIPSRMNTV